MNVLKGTLNKIIQGIINLYGKRLFRIKNDKIIDKIEDNTYVFCKLELLPLKQNVSNTCVTLHEGIVSGLTIRDLKHVVVEHIELVIELSQANSFVDSLLDISFSEETNNDLIEAFKDIKQCLSKYIHWVTIAADLVTIRISDEVIKIRNVCATREKTHIEIIESPYAIIRDLVYTDHITIDSIQVLDIEKIPTVYLSEGKSFPVNIRKISMYDTNISNVSVNDSILIDKIEHSALNIHDLTLDNDITASLMLFDIPAGYAWLTDKINLLSKVSEKIVRPSEQLSSIKLSLDGCLKGTASYRSGSVAINTTEWSFECDDLSFSPLIANHVRVLHPMNLKQTIDLLPEGQSTDMIIQDCTISGIHNGLAYCICVDCKYSGELTDLRLSGSIEGMNILKCSAANLRNIQSIQITLDPKAYDIVNKLVGTWQTEAHEPVSFHETVLTESMLIESYTADRLAETVIQQKVTQCLFTIIEDYTNRPEILSDIHIKDIRVDLHTAFDKPAFAQIHLSDTNIKQTQDLTKTMTMNPAIVTHISTSMSATDTLADNEWRNLATIPKLEVSYSVYENDYDVSVYCKSVKAMIREQCLIKLIAFISPRQCLPTKVQTGIEKLTINAVPLDISFLPVLTTGIPALSMSNHKHTLPAIRVEYCSLDLALSTIKKTWSDSLSLVHIISDIKAVKPITSPIYHICTMCVNYVSRSQNVQLLRSIVQNDLTSYAKQIGSGIFKLIS